MALEVDGKEHVPVPRSSTSPPASIQAAVSPAAPSSPQLPPTPASSCGTGSPPPSAKTPQECRLPLSPPPSAASPRALSFSIENILRPDFGVTQVTKHPQPNKTTEIGGTAEIVLRTPPKTPESTRHDSPVDLSQKSGPPPLTAESTSNTESKLSPPSVDKTGAPANSHRARYPENPEELANPPIPENNMVWPAWVYCTRYSDRPSSGPRSRRVNRRDRNPEEKRPRTAFTSEQLSRLKQEFEENKYLTEKRRQDLAKELGLNESQIKIWFQNKRAKIKKSTGPKNGLAQHLMAQGLYNHSTVPIDEDDPYLT